MFQAPSPALPWEVIERVIGHSAGRTRTLYSFALTCRQLNPRSSILLLHRVELENRVQALDLCAMLQAKPHLQPCVRSVSIPLDEFSPHQLFRMLPRLSEIEFLDKTPGTQWQGLLLPSSVLHYCRKQGEHIQTLSLRRITFRSLSDLSATLLSFPRIQALSCTGVDIRSDLRPGVVHEPEVTTRLSKRLQSLRSLTIGEANSEMVLTLLIDVAKQRLATLTYTTQNDADMSELVDKLLMASTSDWVQLTALTWRIDLVGATPDHFKSDIRRIVAVLKDFHPTKLREVTVVFDYCSLGNLVLAALHSSTELCAELEQTLITFPAPTISFYPSPESQGMNGRRYHSWMRTLGRFFPVLAERRALRIDAESWYAGHDEWIRTPIVTSADSRWAATGSNDGTIIIWDLDKRCISREWFVEDSSAVDFLAFSPDSRYIMSVGRDITRRGWEATIWDLSHEVGACRVRSLIGQGDDIDPDSNEFIRCAWSPDGSWIAAGPQGDDVTYVWETSTAFEDLSSHPTGTWKGGLLLAVSSDGHWVITTLWQGVGCCQKECWIWSIESGTLHRTLADHTNGAVVVVSYPSVVGSHPPTASNTSGAVEP